MIGISELLGPLLIVGRRRQLILVYLGCLLGFGQGSSSDLAGGDRLLALTSASMVQHISQTAQHFAQQFQTGDHLLFLSFIQTKTMTTRYMI